MIKNILIISNLDVTSLELIGQLNVVILLNEDADTFTYVKCRYFDFNNKVFHLSLLNDHLSLLDLKEETLRKTMELDAQYHKLID